MPADMGIQKRSILLPRVPPQVVQTSAELRAAQNLSVSDVQKLPGGILAQQLRELSILYGGNVWYHGEIRGNMVVSAALLEYLLRVAVNLPEQHTVLASNNPQGLQPAGAGGLRVEAFTCQLTKDGKYRKFIGAGVNAELVAEMSGDRGVSSGILPETGEISDIVNPLLKLTVKPGSHRAELHTGQTQLVGNEKVLLRCGGLICLVHTDFQIDRLALNAVPVDLNGKTDRVPKHRLGLRQSFFGKMQAGSGQLELAEVSLLQLQGQRRGGALTVDVLGAVQSNHADAAPDGHTDFLRRLQMVPVCAVALTVARLEYLEGNTVQNCIVGVPHQGQLPHGLLGQNWQHVKALHGPDVAQGGDAQPVTGTDCALLPEDLSGRGPGQQIPQLTGGFVVQRQPVQSRLHLFFAGDRAGLPGEEQAVLLSQVRHVKQASWQFGQ